MANIKTCRSTPTIITGEIQHEVLARFRNIDKNDVTYLNKTEKALDELRAFDYTRNDAITLANGIPEAIEVTFTKERSAKLEYQDDALYERSTTNDYNQLSVSPHSNQQTKLLELRPLDREDFFAKMYARFVTESILYNVAMGYAEDVLKIEYGEITAYLSIKDLLILFLYCEGQIHGWFDKNKDLALPTNIALCIPYKKSFDRIPDYYKWRNIECYTPYVLNIIPEEITLTSGTYRQMDSNGEYVVSATLPEEAEGVYRLTNPDEPKTKWKWENDAGSSIVYDIEKSGTGRWVFSIAVGENGITTYSNVQIPYWNWLCWHPDLVYINDAGEDLTMDDAELKVTKFHYVMDDRMPNYETFAYFDPEYPDEDLVHLIDKQASNFIDMYKEYMLSGWSRQHAAFLQILDDRVFRGIVNLNLSPYKTYKEHIANSNELTELLRGFDYLTSDTKREEYQYLADAVIKLLYPIDSPYLVDASLQLSGKLNRITDLVKDLCSYNVAWVADPSAFGNTIIDCSGSNTLDIVKSVYGMTDVSRITETDVHTIFQMGIVDRWCYDAIYDKQYIWNTDNTVCIMVYLIKQMQLGIKDSTIERAITRYKNHKEQGTAYNAPTNKLPLAVMDRLYNMAIELGYDPFKEFIQPTLYDIPTPHCCPDHQYVINSYIETSISTIIMPVEYGENGERIGQGFTTIVSLADTDQPRSLLYPTTEAQIMHDINQFIDAIITNREQYSDLSGFRDVVMEYGADKVRLFLSMLYHLKFRDATLASLLDGDYEPRSYVYQKPTQGIRVVTKPNLINK